MAPCNQVVVCVLVRGFGAQVQLLDCVRVVAWEQRFRWTKKLSPVCRGFGFVYVTPHFRTMTRAGVRHH